MPERGQKLRSYREAWGWTTRQLEDASRKLAELVDDPSYIVTAPQVSRIERGQASLSNVRFGAVDGMAELFSLGPKAWNELRSPRRVSVLADPIDGPAFTRPIHGGRYAERISTMLQATYSDHSIPEFTDVKPFTGKDAFDAIHPFNDRRRYLRAVVGLKDTCLRSIISPGTMLLVDREATRIPAYEFFQEHERPWFLIRTHFGMYCCWCDALDGGRMLKVAAHPTSPLPHRGLHEPLKMDRDVDIVGEVAFHGMESRRHQRRRMKSC